MFKVGLTGGIGCGKTTIANLFAGLGVPILDADKIARELTMKGEPAFQRIHEEFGDQILNPDGSLDRLRLKNLIFDEFNQKVRLEAILHPLIFSTINSKLSQLHAPYCILCIPLLFETKMEVIVDRILVVDCPVELQVERVKKRDNLDIEVIQAIINSQATRTYRRANADDLLVNDEIDIALAEQVKKLHNLYLFLSTCQYRLTCDQQNHL
ncbi:MAG TPA: dephospho-CoA kinase [Methylomicrobium sp.]|nr:dephospho-CoA kinase [Methylomicrobium sp.]